MVALALRLYQLGAESLWIDEGFSLRDADYLQIDSVRPLYFVLLRGWMEIGGGRNEFLLRLPSAVFGATAVWVLFLIGRRIFDLQTGLLASAFMAASVLHINHSQEVRMYSLTVLLFLLATYSLLLWLEHGRRVHILAYLGCALASLLAFPLTILSLGAHGVFLLAYARTYRPASYYLLGSAFAAALAWSPWLLCNVHAVRTYSQGLTSVMEKPSAAALVSLLGRFFLWKWSDPGAAANALVMAFSVAIFALILFGLKDFRRANPHHSFALLWFAIPILGLATMSYLLTNMWMVHYLIAASPAAFLLIGKGILSMRNRFLAACAVGAILIATIGRLGLYYTRHDRPQWRTAVSYIQAHEKPGDVIGVYYAGNRYVFQYYYRGTSRWAPIGSEEVQRQDFEHWNAARVEALMNTFPLKGDRFWLVLSHHTMRGGFSIVHYLKQRYRVLDHRSYHLMEMYLFDTRGLPISPVIAGGDRPS